MLTQRATWRRWVSILISGVSVVLGAAWYFTLAPTYLGGPATYVMVFGHSMEPVFHTGDLVIAVKQPSYSLGERVVFNVPKLGNVVHDLHGGSASAGWQTKGVNNQNVDAWTVANDNIQGKFLASVPNVGHTFIWVGRNPYLFAAGLALLSLIPYLPRHRKRLAQELKVALRFATKEPRRDGRTNAEYGAFGVSLLGTAAVFYMTVRLYAEHKLYTSAGYILLAADVVSLGITALLVYRLYDGRGVREPSASMYALAGRLHLVEEFPKSAANAEPVKSVIELRKIAEEYRLPVLHRIDAVTGQHSFLLITAKKGSYLWQPPRRSAGYASKIFEAPEKRPAGSPKPVKRVVKAAHRA